MEFKLSKKVFFSLVTSLTILASSIGFLATSLNAHAAGIRDISEAAYNDTTEFTTNGDVLVIFHDEVSGVQAIDEAETLSKDSKDKKAFEGFTGYLNSLSAGSFTISGAPGIVSGGDFNPYLKTMIHHDLNFKQWDKYDYKNAIDKYNGSSKVNKMAYINAQVLNPTNNWRDNPEFGNSFAPKNVTFTNTAELQKHRGKRYFETTEDHYRFYNDLPDEISVDKNATKKNVKYLFSETTHIKDGKENYLVHDTSSKSDVGMADVDGVPTKMYERQALDEALEADNKLFEKLKKLNLYDDMTIVIVSDHGSHMRPWKFNNKDTKEFYDSYIKNDSEIRKFGEEYDGIFRINSTLLVKPPLKKASLHNYDKGNGKWKPLYVDKDTFTTNADTNQFINQYNDLGIDWHTENNELSNYVENPAVSDPDRILNSFKLFWYVKPTGQYHYYDFARKYMEFKGGLNDMTVKDVPLDQLPSTFHDGTLFHNIKGLDDDGYTHGHPEGWYTGVKYEGVNTGTEGEYGYAGK